MKLLDSNSLYDIFWNKYLIQTSNINRERKFFKINFYLYLLGSLFKFISKDILSSFSIVSLLFSYFFLPKINYKEKNIFLFSHLSEIRNINDKYKKLRINLYPIITIKNSSQHFYKTLDFIQAFNVIMISIFTSPKIYYELFMICKKEKVNFLKYIFINNIAITSIIELNLQFICLKNLKNKKSISTYSQFCPYLQLLSSYKKKYVNVEWKLYLCQHGVYEIDRFKREYNKVYADKLFYKFNQSLIWLKLKYIYNKDCQYYLVSYKTNIKSYLKKFDQKKIIAYASSGFFKRDIIVLKKLDLIIKDYKNIHVIYYPHPQVNSQKSMIIKKIFKDLSIEYNKRFKNIDLLITGYSSIGIDYLNMGVKALFLPFDDSICAFKDKSLILERDETLIIKKIENLLLRI